MLVKRGTSNIALTPRLASGYHRYNNVFSYSIVMADAQTSPLPLFLTPEEEEIETKQAELAALQQQAIGAEQEFKTLCADLKAFEAEYVRVLGPCFEQMEQLKADAAATKPRSSGGDDITCPSAQQAACPPGEFKTLFREVAKTMHPDLASSDEERRRRDEAMAHANAAYADGDHDKLREMLHRWKADPDAVEGDDAGARLIRLIRSIARAKTRLTQIRAEIRDLRQSDSYFLRQRAERAAEENRDLLAELCVKLEQQIVQQRERVQEMKRNTASTSVLSPG